MSKEKEKKNILKKFQFEDYVRIDKKHLKQLRMQKAGIQKYIKKKAPDREAAIYESDENTYYIYNAEKVKIYTIEDIPSYLEKITEYKEKTLFFRGHPNSNYFLQPSIVRNEKARKNEKRMFDELERLCPKDLYDLKTILDKLVEMQHYNLSTRLLDITSSALVALLFACQNSNVDGEVIVLEAENPKSDSIQKKGNLCYGHSDKVSLLTGISQMNYSDQLLLYYITEIFNEFVNEKDNNKDFWYEKINKMINILYEEERSITQIEEGEANSRIDPSVFQLYNLINKRLADKARVIEIRKIEDFNNIDVVKRLYRHILREKPYFESRIISEDICNVLFVKPPMLNQRIVQQSGAFIIVGAMPKENMDIVSKLNKCRYKENGKKPIFIIPSKCKHEILEGLKVCDLHTGTIYPEIEEVAKYIKETIE